MRKHPVEFLSLSLSLLLWSFAFNHWVCLIIILHQPTTFLSSCFVSVDWLWRMNCTYIKPQGGWSGCLHLFFSSSLLLISCFGNYLLPHFQFLLSIELSVSKQTAFQQFKFHRQFSFCHFLSFLPSFLTFQQKPSINHNP